MRWQGNSRNLGLVVFLAATLSLFLPVLGRKEGPGTTALIFLVIAFVVAVSYADIAVTIDDEELLVRGGPFRMPLMRIPRTQIVAAEAVDARPLSYGGWGLRYGGKQDKRGWAIVVRRGEALLVERRAKKPFLITVDDAREAARVLNTPFT